MKKIEDNTVRIKQIIPAPEDLAILYPNDEENGFTFSNVACIALVEDQDGHTEVKVLERRPLTGAIVFPGDCFIDDYDCLLGIRRTWAELNGTALPKKPTSKVSGHAYQIMAVRSTEHKADPEVIVAETDDYETACFIRDAVRQKRQEESTAGVRWTCFVRVMEGEEAGDHY